MQPLRAHSWAEAHLYLKVTPCEQCSQGPWEVRPEGQDPGSGKVRARCLHCGAEKDFIFECSPSVESEGPDAAAVRQLQDSDIELVNASSEASRIIDVAQWLSLFSLFVETASKTSDKAESRRVSFLAAQCLDEAMKFYGEDDELPPQSALFTDSAREAFAKHPERFARSRLRDMRNKLPDPRVMAGVLSRQAGRPAERRWWQFWKR